MAAAVCFCASALYCYCFARCFSFNGEFGVSPAIQPPFWPFIVVLFLITGCLRFLVSANLPLCFLVGCVPLALSEHRFRVEEVKMQAEVKNAKWHSREFVRGGLFGDFSVRWDGHQWIAED